jgi:hypothetical protein
MRGIGNPSIPSKQFFNNLKKIPIKDGVKKLRQHYSG